MPPTYRVPRQRSTRDGWVIPRAGHLADWGNTPGMLSNLWLLGVFRIPSMVLGLHSTSVH
jgi:hypothetical protein